MLGYMRIRQRIQRFYGIPFTRLIWHPIQPRMCKEHGEKDYVQNNLYFCLSNIFFGTKSFMKSFFFNYKLIPFY